MHMIMPKPTIKCSQCGSTDIVIPKRVIPEWPANSPIAQPTGLRNGDVELRCKGCGHEKRHVHLDLDTHSSGISITAPKEQTF